MASASPADILRSSSKKNSFTRLTRLLIDGGTFIIKELFDFIFLPPLASVLKLPQVKTRLKQMKKRKILTSYEWKLLFPTKSSFGKSEDFDISLIFKLLREFGSLTSPPKGWDELPDDSDWTLPADLARIKYYRNVVYAHVKERMELTDCEFEDLWKRIKDALLRIVNYYSSNTNPSAVAEWEKEIENSKTAPLEWKKVKDTEVKLNTWCTEDHGVTKTLAELKDELAQLRARVHQLENAPPVVNVRCTWSSRMQGWIAGSVSTFLILHYKEDPEALVNILLNDALPVGFLVQAIVAGSIILQLRATKVEALDQLLERYNSGQLKEDLEKVFVTEELQTLIRDQNVEFSVEIFEEEIKETRRALVSAQEATKGDETAKEEEKLAHGFQEANITSDFDFDTFDGDIFEDGENKFQAHLAVITSKDQVEQVLVELKKKYPDVVEATHNIWAYRIFDAEKNAYFENCDDDGDDTSGARVLRFLQRTEATDVMVVVSCWYETTADDLGPVRFKYIQKSVLDLILACGIVELQTSKIKKYFEEIKYTPFEKVKEKETPKFEILHGQPIEDRKSTFQGHLADITSRQQVDQVLAELKKDRKIAKAKYNMWACRIYDEKKKSYLEEGNDDGEHLGAERLLHLLRRGDAKNVVVIVTRWHGGIHLGNDRFKHINKCASDLLQQRGRPAAEASTTSDPKETRKKSKKHKST